VLAFFVVLESAAPASAQRQHACRLSSADSYRAPRPRWSSPTCGASRSRCSARQCARVCYGLKSWVSFLDVLRLCEGRLQGSR